MSLSRRTILGGGVVALMGSIVTNGCGSDESDPLGAFLDDTVPAGSSGTLIAARDNDIVLWRGWGAADRDTVYDVMSMTKQFTAAAVLKLQMRGRLKVTDPISAYLGDVPVDKRDITVRHLLTHTAGLVDSLGGDYERLSRDGMVAGAIASRLRTVPGATYHYSNLGYSLLAAIVEMVSGRGYEACLAEELFTPAGMTRTGYVLPNWPKHDVAIEYDARGTAKGRPFDHPWDDDGPYWNLRGNGGLLSTTKDMFRWHTALLGDTVLDAQSRAELFRPRVREEPDGDTFYAYGWVVVKRNGAKIAWHNGGNGWSYGEIARSVDGRAMVFWVTNRVRGTKPDWDFEELGAELTGGVLKRLMHRRAS